MHPLSFSCETLSAAHLDDLQFAIRYCGCASYTGIARCMLPHLCGIRELKTIPISTTSYQQSTKHLCTCSLSTKIGYRSNAFEHGHHINQSVADAQRCIIQLVHYNNQLPELLGARQCQHRSPSSAKPPNPVLLHSSYNSSAVVSKRPSTTERKSSSSRFQCQLDCDQNSKHEQQYQPPIWISSKGLDKATLDIVRTKVGGIRGGEEGVPSPPA